MTPDYGKYGIFLTMANAGFISSTPTVCLQLQSLHVLALLLHTYIDTYISVAAMVNPCEEVSSTGEKQGHQDRAWPECLVTWDPPPLRTRDPGPGTRNPELGNPETGTEPRTRNPGAGSRNRVRFQVNNNSGNAARNNRLRQQQQQQ